MAIRFLLLLATTLDARAQTTPVDIAGCQRYCHAKGHCCNYAGGHNQFAGDGGSSRTSTGAVIWSTTMSFSCVMGCLMRIRGADSPTCKGYCGLSSPGGTNGAYPQYGTTNAPLYGTTGAPQYATNGAGWYTHSIFFQPLSSLTDTNAPLYLSDTITQSTSWRSDHPEADAWGGAGYAYNLAGACPDQASSSGTPPTSLATWRTQVGIGADNTCGAFGGVVPDSTCEDGCAALDAPPAAPPGGQAAGDPHIVAPHGGLFDFRGEDHALYTLHSSRNLTINAMTEFADFQLHEEDHAKHKHVHGSFLTQAHVVARTYTGKLVNVSLYAEVLGKANIVLVNGTFDGVKFKLGPHREKAVDDVSIKTEYSTFELLTREFRIRITPIYLGADYKGEHPPELNVTGVHHRLDIQLELRVPEDELTVAPHGIIGQHWDGDDLAIDGEQDRFPYSGEFTTSAMGKGALEGEPDEYKVHGPYDTHFKYARFDMTKAAPRDAAALVARGLLNRPKKVTLAEGFVGSTERKHTEL